VPLPLYIVFHKLLHYRVGVGLEGDVVVAMEMALVYLHQPRSPPTLYTATLRSWKIENQTFARKFPCIFSRGWVHIETLFIITKKKPRDPHHDKSEAFPST
jgi:hypothetical protein